MVALAGVAMLICVQLSTIQPAGAASGPVALAVVLQSAAPVPTPLPWQASVRVSFGWGIYVTYNRVEVARIARLPIDKAKYGSILCAAIPHAAMALACGLYVYDSAASIATTFRTASRLGRCVQTKYATPSTIIGWKVVSC